MKKEIVKDFIEYLRIKSVQPNPDYDGCVSFLKKMATKIGLPCNVYGTKSKPVVVISWEGTNKNATSIMLNSHMDVVPVFPEAWSFDPFEAHQDKDGKIYARGAQDMKSVGMQHLGAVWKLKKNGFSPKRTIHISFVPDEEIGGKDGMGTFVATPEFKKLNIGFELDESGPSSLDSYIAFNDERTNFSINVHCNGTTGHGSLLHESTAGEKLRFMIDNLMDRREIEAAKIKDKDILTLAGVTSINLTKLSGGVQNNVVPPLITATFDIRLGINENQEKFIDWLEDLRRKAGKDVEIEYCGKEDKVQKTDLDNKFVKTFITSLQKRNIKTTMHPCFGVTDARFIRKMGIPAIGFSPIKNTKLLIHDHDEYIDESIFLEGIEVFEGLIKDLSNV